MQRQEEGMQVSLILRYHMLMLLPLQAVLVVLVLTRHLLVEVVSNQSNMLTLINNHIKVPVIKQLTIVLLKVVVGLTHMIMRTEEMHI